MKDIQNHVPVVVDDKIVDPDVVCVVPISNEDSKQ
jgi:hypothetical protein